MLFSLRETWKSSLKRSFQRVPTFFHRILKIFLQCKIMSIWVLEVFQHDVEQVFILNLTIWRQQSENRKKSGSIPHSSPMLPYIVGLHLWWTCGQHALTQREKMLKKRLFFLLQTNVFWASFKNLVNACWPHVHRMCIPTLGT